MHAAQFSPFFFAFADRSAQVGLGTSFLTYFGYALLVAFGYVRDFFSKYVLAGRPRS